MYKKENDFIEIQNNKREIDFILHHFSYFVSPDFPAKNLENSINK